MLECLKQLLYTQTLTWHMITGCKLTYRDTLIQCHRSEVLKQMEEQVKRKLRLHGVLGNSGFEINDRVGRKQRVYVKI